MKNLFLALLCLCSFLTYSQNYLVTTNGSGAGSLTEAVTLANTDGVPSTIRFDLPSIPSGIVLVDGTLIFTEPNTLLDGDYDGDGDPDITIYGTNPGDLIEILTSQTTIKSLNLVLDADQSPGNAGVKLDGTAATNNSIIGCYLGTTQDGNTAWPFRFHRGIMLINGASDNVIGGTVQEERNIISGNQVSGIYIFNSNDNKIFGNLIGSDIAGLNAIPNGGRGIEVSGSSGTVIGASGTVRNVIVNSNFSGIQLDASPQTIIINNHIGVDETGNTALGNAREGILLRNGCDGTEIGDGTPGNGNIISGNGQEGIQIDGTTTVDILGNNIGISRNGSSGLGNGIYGVWVGTTSTDVNIGNGTADGRNIISGNLNHGILVSGGTNSILGNYIGTNSFGNTSVSNVVGGIMIAGTSVSNQIGNGTANGGNVISGNSFGVGIQTGNNSILGNIIGLSANGTSSIPNLNEGVRLTLNAADNRIGNGSDLGRNTISSNNSSGILLQGDLVERNTINFNYIGIAEDGTGFFPNTGDGISIEADANDNLVTQNVILNHDYGIFVDGSSTIFNEFSQNAISSNTNEGILFQAGAQNGILPPTINNYTPLDAQRFIVDGTADPNFKVEVYGDSDDEGLVFLGETFADAIGNWAFTISWDQLTANELNITAIQASDPSVQTTRNSSEFSSPFSLTFPDPLIVTTTEDFSVIGSLRYATEYITEINLTGATITFDPIIQNQQIDLTSPVFLDIDGTTIDGDIDGDCLPDIAITGFNIPGTAIADDADGIIVTSNNNVIKHLNLQAFSRPAWGDGIRIEGNSNSVIGCYIGTNLGGDDATGTANWNGILIDGGIDNTIGGLTACERNLVSGNIRGIITTNTDNTQIIGNYIGTNLSGDSPLPNTSWGIGIDNNSPNTTIGSIDPAGRNIISGNQFGINVQGGAGAGISIIGNYVGTDLTGTLDLGNTNGIGIYSNSVSVGNGTAAGRNIVSGSSGAGILVQGGSATGVLINNNYVGTDVTGTLPIGNDNQGIYLLASADNNRINDNLVSGNGIGIDIETSDNRLERNLIGTEVTGIDPLPNSSGIRLRGGASGNRIGGSSNPTSNYVSGNSGNGIDIWSGGNLINNNFIGVAADQSTPLPNGNHGIAITLDGSNNNIIGADIAYNAGYGINIQSAGTAEKNIVFVTQIWSNILGGINIEPGSQEDVFPPKITNLTTVLLEGTAAPNADVYLYADSLNQGQLYLSNTTADGSGNWAFPIDTATIPDGLGFFNVLQDSAGNSSAFNSIWHGINSIGPKMYWSDPFDLPDEDQINQSNLDGTGFQFYYSGFDPDQVSGLALDTINNMLFWTEDNSARIFCGRIGHTGFSGTAGPLVDESFTSTRSYKGIDLDVAGGKMYWASPWDGTIKRANLDGTALETIITVAGAYDVALDVVNGKIYYTAMTPAPEVRWANLDGSADASLLTLSLVEMRGIALDVENQHVYFAYSGSSVDAIERIDLNGSNLTTVNGSDIDDPRGLEIDVKQDKLYLVNGATEEIFRMNQDGSGVEVLHSGSFTNNPQFITLDLRNAGQSTAAGGLVVTNTNDSGPGSLRAAMEFANLQSGPDEIIFDIPTQDPGYLNSGGYETWTITIQSQLPDLTEEVTIDGYTQPGNGLSRVIVDGGSSQKLLTIISPGGSDFNVYGLRFNNGQSLSNGAALDFSSAGAGDRIRIYDCIFENNNNLNTSGGAISLADPVSLFIQDSYFIANTADITGGAIEGLASGLVSISGSGFRGNSARDGGGAINISGSHSLSISSSAFIGNDASSGAGGAIYIGNSSHSINNTTFSGNNCFTGGALYLAGASSGVNLTSVTFQSNTGYDQNYDIVVEDGTLTLDHTVLEYISVLSGGVISNGYNFLSEDLSGGLWPTATGDIVGSLGNPIDAELGPLLFNGGLTLNHEPLPGSPLLDNGNKDDLTAYPKDQRGLLRVDGANADIGAVELQVTPDLNKIYWTERIGRDVNRSNIDGTKFEYWELNPSPDPNGVAIDTLNNKIYWTDNNEGSVYRGDINAYGISNIETIHLDGDNPASDIELDLINGKVYWANWIFGSISRANLDGTSPELDFINGYDGILGLAIDLTNAKIYWSSNDNNSGDNIPAILSASLIDGSGASLFYSEPAVADEDYLFVDVDIDPETQNIYWSAGQDGQTGNNKFYLSNTAGIPSPSVLTNVRGEPGGFEADWNNNKIYFVDKGLVSAEPPTIWVMDLDGTNQIPLLEGFSDGIQTPKYMALGFPTVGGGISVNIPTITISGQTEFCSGDSVLLVSSVGESYQWYRDGSPISGADQQSYYAKISGAYNVQVQDGPDLEFALSDVTVSVGILPLVTTQPLDQAACDGGAVLFTTNSSGSDLLFRWEEDSGGGFTALANSGVYSGVNTPDLAISSTAGLDGNLYRLVVTEAGFSVFCSIVTDTVQLSSSSSPTADAGIDQTICSTDFAILSGTIGGGGTTGTWSTNGDGIFSDSTSVATQYTPGSGDIASGTVLLTLTTDASGSCNAATDQVQIILDPSPAISAGADISICPDETVSLNGQIDANGTNPLWTTSGDGAFLDNTALNTSYTPGTTDLASGAVLLVLTASPVAGSCPDVTDTISVAISQPLTSQEQSSAVRLGETVDIDLLNGAFTNPGDILTITITQQPGKGSITGPSNGILTYSPNPTTVGSDTVGFEICNQCNLCTSNIAVIEIENDPPIAQVPPIGGETGSMITIDLTNIVTDPNNNIDTTSLRIVSGPANGAIAFFEGFVLMIDYRNSNFFGEDVIVIEVCDLSGACIQVELRITIDREDVNIINAITPNGDGRHDFFEIENIQFYPDNIVQIFSRWGSKVAEIKGYDNVQRVFTGESEPAGTYYYIIDLKDGSERRSGDLLLKK